MRLVGGHNPNGFSHYNALPIEYRELSWIRLLVFNMYSRHMISGGNRISLLADVRRWLEWEITREVTARKST